MSSLSLFELRRHAKYLRQLGRIGHQDPDRNLQLDASGRDLSHSSAPNKDLRYGIFTKAQLDDVDLTRADLRGADLAGASLRCANLAGADLRGADLSGADLTGAVLDDAQLDDASLRGATLQSVSARSTQLKGAELERAVIRSSDLSGSDLSGALMESTLVQLTDLHRARIEDSLLSGARLQYCRLDGTSFDGARADGLEVVHVDDEDWPTIDGEHSTTPTSNAWQDRLRSSGATIRMGDPRALQALRRACPPVDQRKPSFIKLPHGWKFQPSLPKLRRHIPSMDVAAKWPLTKGAFSSAAQRPHAKVAVHQAIADLLGHAVKTYDAAATLPNGQRDAVTSWWQAIQARTDGIHDALRRLPTALDGDDSDDSESIDVLDEARQHTTSLARAEEDVVGVIADAPEAQRAAVLDGLHVTSRALANLDQLLGTLRLTEVESFDRLLDVHEARERLRESERSIRTGDDAFPAFPLAAGHAEPRQSWGEPYPPAPLDLSGLDLSGMRITDRAFVTNSMFAATDLSLADLSGCTLEHAQFIDSTMSGATFADGHLGGSTFDGARCITTDFRGADLKGASFIGTDLSGALLHGADLTDADLRRASTDGTRFDAAHLEQAIFTVEQRATIEQQLEMDCSAPGPELDHARSAPDAGTSLRGRSARSAMRRRRARRPDHTTPPVAPDDTPPSAQPPVGRPSVQPSRPPGTGKNIGL
jgi:uncharacterized protein YjbI with pentapeptide repeats